MTVSDTHADTPERDWSEPLTSDERARIAQQIIAGAGSGWLGFLYKTYEASERECDRERARADRAEAALAAFLEWAEKDKGGYVFSNPSEEWYAIRDYVRAALSVGSGGREATP